VGIAFAREGADVLISYLDEHDDAQQTRTWVEHAGRKAVLVPGDLSRPEHCRLVIDTAVAEFGRLDVLVSNAAQQRTHDNLEDISDQEWDQALAVNLSAFFYLTKAALPHMNARASIIGTTSVNSDTPTPTLLPYDVTNAGIANMTAALAQLLAPRGIRANSVAPGPIWTLLIPSTMPSDHVESFGTSVPLDRPGQPAQAAPVYVMLASDEASYVSGSPSPEASRSSRHPAAASARPVPNRSPTAVQLIQVAAVTLSPFILLVRVRLLRRVRPGTMTFVCPRHDLPRAGPQSWCYPSPRPEPGGPGRLRMQTAA
jgi:hypothetical protein